MRIQPKRQVEKLSSRPGRMFKAYLAEDYDGIGQYVMVILSRNAVTNALRGRIASGDFGGSRTFPEGTPVVVISNRGQLEVFLGNQPNPVWDNLNRVESTGWGLNTPSQTYTWGRTGQAIETYVDGEYGIVKAIKFAQGGSESPRISTFGFPQEVIDFQQSLVRLKINGDADGSAAEAFSRGTIRFGNLGRLELYGDNRFQQQDGIFVPSGIDFSQFFLVRGEASADVLKFKIWQDDAEEPESWYERTSGVFFNGDGYEIGATLSPFAIQNLTVTVDYIDIIGA